MNELTQLRSRLTVGRPQPGGFLAHCPVPGHGQGRGDRRTSLSVRLGRTGVPVLRCHGGCATRDVLAAIGWSYWDLYR
jgi:putative DNA primase/helicase